MLFRQQITNITDLSDVDSIMNYFKNLEAIIDSKLIDNNNIPDSDAVPLPVDGITKSTEAQGQYNIDETDPVYINLRDKTDLLVKHNTASKHIIERVRISLDLTNKMYTYEAHNDIKDYQLWGAFSSHKLNHNVYVKVDVSGRVATISLVSTGTPGSDDIATFNGELVMLLEKSV